MVLAIQYVDSLTAVMVELNALRIRYKLQIPSTVNHTQK